jgi:hypothetical protein
MTATAISSRATRYRRVAAAFLIVLGVCLLGTTRSSAQSITSGDVTGIVTDPSGAAVPNASVTLTNVNTNSVQKATTNAAGSYSFAFTTPGAYKVEISASGFQTTDRTGLNVNAGSPTTVDVQLAVATASTSVNVVEAPPLLQTENADTGTNVNAQMIQDLPNAGMDLTFFAQTTPGVVMNTQSGYGNFSAQGMPGISNLFSINGMNYNDPFLGLNNSGASNLTLGANDIVEANVTNNAYSGQYGQYAGAQLTYISRSGSNQFHGDAIYNWNGRVMNANQFFSNSAGLPRPFNNFNQGATYVSGPIRKDRTFFDVDYELLRNLLPTNAVLNVIPSPQFQAATLANLAAIGDSSEIPFYKQAFAIYNIGAPGATALPGGGCNGNTFAGLAAGAPCAEEFRLTPTSLNHEYLYNVRVDHQFSDHDRGYIRVGRDNGFQPTYTSPFGSTFNASSNQPQMSGQVSEIHTFNSTTVNQLNGSVLYYAAIFAPSDGSGALAGLPTYLHFTDGAFQDVGAYGSPGGYFYPNGRRVFQYQFSDDFSKVWGRHTFRLGYSWVHQTVSDLDFSSIGGPIYGALNTNLVDFFNGGGGASSSSYLNQAFPTSPENGIRFNTNGGYIADDWKATDRLTVSLNLRLESYANPTCDQNCFSRLAAPFNGSAVPNALSTPYNQMIVFGQHSAYANVQTAIWQPRVGVAYRPFNSDKTVIRTGAGIFADNLPGGLAENAAFNAPGFNAFFVPAPTLAPGAPGNPFSAAAASNAALQAAFKSGGSFNSISAAVPGFGAPNFSAFPSTFKTPHYYKWNFEVQQQLPWRMVLTVNYAGMHGVDIPIGDFGLNGYCPKGAGSICPNGIAGLPTAAPNPALGVVEQYLSAGVSSYNGLITSLQRRMSDGLTFTVNYTWSHSLDDVSNGGIANEPYSIVSVDPSITTIGQPFNIRANYGDSDYDVRNYFSANAVQTDLIRHLGFKKGPNMILGGWTLSFNVFARSGLPFSVVDNSATGALFSYNLDGPIFATQTTRISGTNCGANAVNVPCLSTSEFAPAFGTTGVLTGFGNTGRNSFRGPDFVNVDMSITKDFQIKERARFQIGAQFYNLFNHPNFDNPLNDVSNTAGLFGSAISTVSPPTSLLGAFLGAGGSPRFIEFKGKFSF